MISEIKWQYFDVNSDSCYTLFGLIENEVNESTGTALIIFNFEDKQLTNNDIKFNSLEISPKYGYHYLLSKKKDESFFYFNLKIPSNIKVLSVGLINNKNLTTIKIRKLEIIQNSNANYYRKESIIFKHKYLQIQQENILFKNSLAYRLKNAFIKSKKSVKNRLFLPLTVIKILLGHFKNKQYKLRINIWQSLSNTPLKESLNLETGNKVEIQGRYFALDGEKKNSILVYYTLDADVTKGEMKKLGFNYSEQFGYFNYIHSIKEGEQSFIREIIFPSYIKQVTLNFRNWHSIKPILLKIERLQVLEPQKQEKISMREVNTYANSIIKKEILSLIGWQEYLNPTNKPIVMAVMDEFTTGCFEDEVCLIQPRPDNWLALIKTYKPDLVFIESAWKGNYGSWQYRVADYSNKPGDEIEQISEYCKQKNIPMIFWNKEDPVHHQKFMCSAKLATHIFTTDSNMIESYRKNTNCKKVFSLPFAAQPTLHKPKSLISRINKSCFAGSWYGNRHAERGESMKWLLEAANIYGLDIFDRNFGTGIFPFPEQYQDGIKGSLPYKELCEEYSKYRVFLNVNSVTDSPTMFSRRVFELMACGTPIVSTYAKGIEELFDTDAVWLVNTKEEALNAIRTLMTDDKEWRRRSLLGIREVFSKHTYSHRLNYIFESIGINSKINIEPKIVLLARISSEIELDEINKFIESQSYKNIIVYVESSSIDISTNFIINKNIILCSNLEEIIDNQTDSKAIGWIDTGAKYGSYYIQDLLNAIVYEPNANGWAKSKDCDYFSYDQVTLLSASIWKPEIFINHYFETEIQNSVQDEKLFVIDSNEYISEKEQGDA